MKEEEKQRKFHQSLLQMLYPPPPNQQEDEDDERELITPLNNPPEEDLEDKEGYSLPSSSDDDNQKMTRAQRKRLRKKKLKETASRRRKIIGPLLPDSIDGRKIDNVDVVEDGSLSVRQNASMNASEPGSCSKQKVKQRRKSKKLACKTLNSSSIESNSNHQSFDLENVNSDDDRTEL